MFVVFDVGQRERAKGHGFTTAGSGVRNSSIRPELIKRLHASPGRYKLNTFEQKHNLNVRTSRNMNADRVQERAAETAV